MALLAHSREQSVGRTLQEASRQCHTIEQSVCAGHSRGINISWLAVCEGQVCSQWGGKGEKGEKEKRGEMDKKVNALEFCLAVAARSVSCCEIKSACMSC
jgi:hypothetical protein